MEYRYYVHDREKNVGVTEFSSKIKETFVECLLDCVEWFMWESDATCLYEIYVFNEDKKILITFTFDEQDEMIAMFFMNGENHSVFRDDVRDFVKASF